MGVGLARRAPAQPILRGDIPPGPEPLPKFLTDQQAAAFI
jgi:hypothetical protein